ncbi:bifunctional 2',3'-cyclic-nucleotide 2'-phosphodiesterase/3'-nucleotidase [Bacillus sp. HMF5848]|uniref:bifunctional 2',3'-cyclic-nucleotide 2'-phosphodiesterase/3'-nucleotidase n=1 Tax=Bacillus sp. HMF5848 TaxID=2495421 RepID=UPI000F7B8029|nr:bifunctional 2',3'-cyclic-nucleotide 2'-phosphodiesterase/3'-nucleotidase [Bacillus sp. HMF5848]RSK26154.1 bifunctional 2',3'-cyclic-nucleotide 2'-phosphodiesterase/3'-nucleotidase [Bacillus sp. HMF5848]
MKKFRSKKTIASAALALGLIIPQASPAITYAEVMDQDIVKFRIVETSDLHSNVMNYDYYQNSTGKNYGIAKAATVIQEARDEVANSILVDNGDTIQGSPVGDYVVNKDLMEQEGYVHPIIRAMNLLDYDFATVGNHEFNYGLDFLNAALEGAEFPYVNANVYDTNGENYFTPFEIVEKEVVDTDGETHTIKIGVTGFVPPDIMNWDEKHLNGKLVVEDIVKSAEKVVPEMKAAGADVVVVLAHSGIADYDENGNLKPYAEMMENAGYYLSQVEDVDAILTGHQHRSFPNVEKPSFQDGNGIDNATGTINGVPVAMPSSWGSDLGLIDLTIEKVDGKWDVTEGQASLRSTKDATLDADIEADVVAEHEATIEYMGSPVGELKGDLNTYFALVKDNASMEIVNRAQTAYVEKALKGTEYEGLPILSAAAPFKAGRSGVDNYTNVPSGTIAIKNVADLYYYDNNVVTALKITGDVVQEWLEWSAGQFNQIDPNSTEEQKLVNTDFPTYNFDVIDGVTYEIDVTQPAKYDKGQNVINPDANRIKNLMYNGQPVTADMEFIVAANDYRAGTGKLMNPGGANTILKAPDSNRDAVMAYVKENGVVDASVNNNWSFTPIAGDVNVVFHSNPAAEAIMTDDMTYTGVTDEKGFGFFTIDLSPKVSFADVPAGYWASDYISSLAKKGIVHGKDPQTFDPESTVTRGQFVAMIVRALGLSDGSGDIQKEIEIAYNNGITTLTPAEFGASNTITRQQMAAMVMRAYEVKLGAEYNATTTATYKDSGAIADEFSAYVNEAAELGFMTGYDNGSFGPNDGAKRSQAAKVVYMFLSK